MLKTQKTIYRETHAEAAEKLVVEAINEAERIGRNTDDSALRYEMINLTATLRAARRLQHISRY